MSDRSSLYNRLDHRELSDLHGVPSRQRPRQPTKIDVPPQGAVSRHTRKNSNRKSPRNVPNNNFVFSDTLYGDGLDAAPVSSSNNAFLATTKTNDRPSPRAYSARNERSSNFPPPISIKGKALQTEGIDRSPSVEDKEPGEQEYICIDSDEERNHATTPGKTNDADYNENWSVFSGSKALAAKDQRRRQDNIQPSLQDSEHFFGSNGARPSGPIPLEQPSDSRSAAALRKLSFSKHVPLDTSHSPFPVTGGKALNMAARMKPKGISLPNVSPPAVRSSGSEGGESPMDRYFKSPTATNRRLLARSAQSTQAGQSTMTQDESFEIALQRLVISDVWRSADDADSDLVAVIKPSCLDVQRRGQNVLFSIRYADFSVLECTLPDVSAFGLFSISLKPNSPSVAEVQRQFRHYDPRASADACELLLVAKSDDLNMRKQSRVAQHWAAGSLEGTRWLDRIASETKFRSSDSVRAAPWPGAGSSFSPSQRTIGPSRPKRELILPGTDRQPSPKNMNSEPRSSIVELQYSPEQSKSSRKTFNLYSDSLEDISKKESPPPAEQNSPPLQKLVVPAKRSSAASSRAETRSRTKQYSNHPIVQFPFEGIGAVTLLESDLRRLDDGELLNDTVIEFAMKLMHEDIRKRDPQLADSIYIFNTFFYKILTESKDMGSSYNKVRKWTSKIDLFSKKYIVVPINEDLHWYLALIINPWFMLQPPKDPTPSPGTAQSTAQHISISENEASNNEADASTRSITGDSGSHTGQRPESPEHYHHHVPAGLESFYYETAPSANDVALPLDASAVGSSRANAGTASLNNPELGLAPILSTTSDRTRSNSESLSSHPPRRAPKDLRPVVSPQIGMFSSRSSPRQLAVDDRRKKPVHIKFDEFGEPDVPLGGNNLRNQADPNLSPVSKHSHQRHSSITVEIGQNANLSRPSETIRSDEEPLHLSKRARNWREAFAQNDSLSSDRSFDTLDGEEIMRVGRGKLEGGGPTIDLSGNGSDSPTNTRSRTRILPGDGRRDTSEPVGASSFYSSSHRKQRRVGKDDTMDIDTPEPATLRERKTASRISTSNSERSTPSLPVYVDLDDPTPNDLPCNLDRCFVITLDSLGIQHRTVGKQLREYLWREARDKDRLAPSMQTATREEANSTPNKPPASFPDPFCFQSRVPQQPNFCDCGIYLLHYFDRFFSDPDQSLRLAVASAEARAGKRQTRAGSTPAEKGELVHWQAGNVHGKRQYWRHRALDLSEGWKEFQERRNAEKLRASKAEEDSAIIFKPEDEAEPMEVEAHDVPSVLQTASQSVPQASVGNVPNDLDPTQSKTLSEPRSRNHLKSPPSTPPVSEDDLEPRSQQPVLRSRIKGKLSSRSLRREGSSDAETPARTVHLVHDSDDETPLQN